MILMQPWIWSQPWPHWIHTLAGASVSEPSVTSIWTTPDWHTQNRDENLRSVLCLWPKGPVSTIQALPGNWVTHHF